MYNSLIFVFYRMSFPDEYLLFRAEGKIWNGPDGAQVSPDCPFVVKQVAELKNKSFEQVRRAILKNFQLNEATHELTLQHILYVRTDPSAPPYNVLIDIVGEESWRAFFKVACRHVRSFKLFAKWTVKKTSSASNATDSNITTVIDEDTAITDDSDDGGWPACKHDKPCTIETSWDRHDPGRRFYRCPFFANPKEDCKFTKWLDKKFPEKANELINKYQDTVDSLQQQVDNLKCELEELRRRHRKRSAEEVVVSHGDKCPCGKSLCDLTCRGREKQTRPGQI
ncbi:unnamed protein product [Triticum turgidum subsp. durum]|uniref:GRF-type domain-containing protein n=2 Tax=Triticum TaxID=4564 RepID=A0A9R1RRD8_TRITD|nr:unnamed protein product [Triticum turgidum subsp. durum]